MRENSIESKFRDEVKEVGGMAYKFVSPGNAGVPDRVVILQGGKSGFVELKRPGEKTTPLQKVQISKILATGCYATVLDNKKDIDRVIWEIEAWNPGKAPDKITELEQRGMI